MGSGLAPLVKETPDGRLNPSPSRRASRNTCRAVSHSQEAAAACATHHESRVTKHETWPLCLSIRRREGDALEVSNHVEMGIVAQHRQNVLAGERGDPDIIGRQGVARAFQFQADGGVGVRRRVGNRSDFGQRQVAAKPVLIAVAMARLAK